MSAANPSWGRWILASLSRHLHAVATEAKLPLVIEAVDERTSSFMDATHRAEANIVGPHTRELSPKLHTVQVNVFCVLTSQVGGEGYDAGAHRDLAGAIHSALDRSIEIREYQAGNDSPALVGCIAPRTGPTDAITVTPLRASDTAKETTTVIEARLIGQFTQP